MIRIFNTFGRLGLMRKPPIVRNEFVRTFLSDSFRLENVWNDRLTSPILKKININDMFFELDNQFQHFGSASALDIDLFINAVDDDSNFDEVEDLVYKLRLTTEAINILPSTHHAIIRLYLKFNKIKDLVRVLDDRMNYGIFADEYCNILMLDTFIKEGNFRDAAKVGSYCMLQEDMSNDLIKYMSLYACHKYLENPVPWKDEVQSEGGENEDDDEEVKVRVRYIRNPYFDDHFDLVDPKHLIGKTFHFIGTTIDDHIGRTYKLIGLILHEKLAEAKEYLSLLSKNSNQSIAKDGLNMAHTLLSELSKDESKASLLPLINELKNLLDKQPVTESSLLVDVENRVKQLVTANENSEIDKQIKTYELWEKTREKLLMEQIAKINREKQLAEVQRQKQLLKAKEEELFFFDNEDKLDLIIEEKEKRKEEQRERERIIMEAKLPKKKDVVIKRKVPVNPPLKEFIDDNIPTKLINTKL